MQEPLLAWDRDNPFRQCFTRSQHFLSQTEWAPQCETGPTFDQFHRLSSASDLVGYTLIDLTHQDFRISVATQGGGGVCLHTDWAWIKMEVLKKLLKGIVSVKLRAYVKDYCKRNGLLTLSVIAVVTGCVLGFVLRSLNLSTQVWMNGRIEIWDKAMWLALGLTVLHYVTLTLTSENGVR